jgi:hypothetical protein
MVNMQGYELALICFDLLLLVPVLFAVLILCGFHTYYVLTNTTTIEAFQKERVEREVLRQRVKPVRALTHRDATTYAYTNTHTRAYA